MNDMWIKDDHIQNISFSIIIIPILFYFQMVLWLHERKRSK